MCTIDRTGRLGNCKVEHNRAILKLVQSFKFFNVPNYLKALKCYLNRILHIEVHFVENNEKKKRQKSYTIESIIC